jgi:predicted MFS family arabinose efflux permease
VLADRFDRRNLLVGVHAGQALLTLWMAERAAAGDLASLQLLVVARSLLSGLDWPARSGAIRRLVSEEDLLTAHAMGGAVWSSMYAFGMAMGGLVSAYGIPQALLVDAFSFVFGALLLTTLPPMPTRGAGSLGEAARKAFSDLAEAARLASRSSGLLLAVASKTPMSLAGGAGVVVLNLVADATAFAGSGAASLGLLQAFRGIGTGVGPLLVERIVASGARLDRVWAAVVGLGFAGIAAMALLSGPWWALLAAALVWGVGTGSNWMISSAELQRRAPDAAIGRLSGLDMLMAELAFALSALAGGATIEAIGSWPAGAALAVGAGAAAWLGIQAAARRLQSSGA